MKLDDFKHLNTTRMIKCFTLKQEQWRIVTGYEGLYEVSNMGRVKSLAKKKGFCFLKESLMSLNLHKGYLRTFLRNPKDKTFKTKQVNRLVAGAFVFKPVGWTDDWKIWQADHLDGNKLNNEASNLEWVTTSENKLRAFRMGLIKPRFGKNNNFTKLTEKEVLEIRSKYKSRKYTQQMLAEEFNVSRSNIGMIIQNKTWTYINTSPE